MRIKFFTGIVIHFWMMLFFCLPLADAAKQVVKVGVYENPPKIFTDKNGLPAGIFVDILQGIAENENWELTYVFGTWTQGLDRLEKGEIDLMPDVAHSTELEKLFAFHKVPVLSSWFQVYVPTDSQIRSIVDLAGKQIFVLERSVQQNVFSQMVDDFGLNITLIPLPDYQHMFEKIGKGEADAVVTNQFFGLMNADKYDLKGTAIIFHPTNLFFAAPMQGREQLLTAIDIRLAALKASFDSTYYRSLGRWLSKKVVFFLPAWIKLIGIIAIVVMLFILGGSMLLKRQVNARTRELRQLNQQMEERIKQRTAELSEAMEKAKAADHLKSAFLATMSHELRTPLNSIIGFTGILLQGLAGSLNEEQKKQMGMVKNSSLHLLALINDVLDISKIEAGQLRLSPTLFALKPVIEKTLDLISPAARKKAIALQLEIAPDVSEVTQDQRRLEQVILNLLNNAVKFTDKGRIRIVCRRLKDQYQIAVTDTGMGIRPEDIPSLFAPFHQVETGLARRHEGTGLGLSISKKLIEMMGGTIAVESTWEQGSTFSIWFPENVGGCHEEPVVGD